MSKVAVLVPTYNVSSYIDYCLRSLYAQDYPDVSIFVRDDCSTDNTREVLKQHEYRNPHIALGENNIGWAASYNLLADLAITKYGADYIFIMGADDYLEPTCISKMMAAIEGKDFSIVWGQMFGDDNKLMTSKEDAKPEDFRDANQICNFALINKLPWLSAQGYDTLFQFADWELWIRLLKKGCTYSVVKEPLYHYRLHAGNVHKKADPVHEHNLIINRHFQ